MNVLDNSGVIAVDDVFRPQWPEVSMAIFGSGLLESAGFSCFAIGFNKSYFCKRDLVEKYQGALRSSSFLSFYLAKVYAPKDNAVLIYQQFPLPEWGFRTLMLWALSIYRPDFFVYLCATVKRLKDFVRGLIRNRR